MVGPPKCFTTQRCPQSPKLKKMTTVTDPSHTHALAFITFYDPKIFRQGYKLAELPHRTDAVGIHFLPSTGTSKKCFCNIFFRLAAQKYEELVLPCLLWNAIRLSVLKRLTDLIFLMKISVNREMCVNRMMTQEGPTKR